MVKVEIHFALVKKYLEQFFSSFCRLRKLEVQKVVINKLHSWYFLIKVTEKILHKMAFNPSFYVACITHAIMPSYRLIRQMH